MKNKRMFRYFWICAHVVPCPSDDTQSTGHVLITVTSIFFYLAQYARNDVQRSRRQYFVRQVLYTYFYVYTYICTSPPSDITKISSTYFKRKNGRRSYNNTRIDVGVRSKRSGRVRRRCTADNIAVRLYRTRRFSSAFCSIISDN